MQHVLPQEPETLLDENARADERAIRVDAQRRKRLVGPENGVARHVGFSRSVLRVLCRCVQVRATSTTPTAISAMPVARAAEIDSPSQIDAKSAVTTNPMLTRGNA